MDERIKKIKELLENEEFGNEIKDLDSAEGFQAAFKAHGVELTLEEVDSVLVHAAIANGNGDEISEDELEQVAGGSIFVGALVVAGGLALSYGVGWAVGRYVRNKTGVCR